MEWAAFIGRTLRQAIGALAFGYWQQNSWAALAFYIFLLTMEF